MIEIVKDLYHIFLKSRSHLDFPFHTIAQQFWMLYVMYAMRMILEKLSNTWLHTFILVVILVACLVLGLQIFYEGFVGYSMHEAFEKNRAKGIIESSYKRYFIISFAITFASGIWRKLPMNIYFDYCYILPFGLVFLFHGLLIYNLKPHGTVIKRVASLGKLSMFIYGIHWVVISTIGGFMCCYYRDETVYNDSLIWTACFLSTLLLAGVFKGVFKI